MSESTTGITWTDEAAAEQPLSLLQRLQAEAERKVFADTIRLNVPSRPGWSLEFDKKVDATDIETYQKRATPIDPRTKKPGKTNAVNQYAFLLLDRCRGIYFTGQDGKPQLFKDEAGDAVTLTSLEFIDAFKGEGDRDALAAAVTFLTDPVVLQLGGAVLRFAGWDEEAEIFTEDPTDA